MFREKKCFFQEYFEMIYCDLLCSCRCRESSVRISPIAHSNIFAHARRQHDFSASLEGCTAMVRNMLSFNFAVYHE